MDFYRNICTGLGVEISAKKSSMFSQIQEGIKTLYKDRKITPVIILDEAQYLRNDILNDLKILFNFEMDSINMATLILIGQPILNDILSRQIHEALRQRIIVNYLLHGLDKEEMIKYVKDRLKLAGVNQDLFEKNALEAIFACINGSTRKLNNLIEKCLIIGCTDEVNSINSDVVMKAENDINLG